jgi:hypothetical protein
LDSSATRAAILMGPCCRRTSSNTQAFRFFQRAYVIVHTRVSKTLLECPLCFLRSFDHQSWKTLCGVGSSMLSSKFSLQMCQTSLAVTHCKRTWFAVSSSWRQTKQVDVRSCKPCRNRLSDVQSLPCIVRHMKSLQRGEALLFQIPLLRGNRLSPMARRS